MSIDIYRYNRHTDYYWQLLLQKTGFPEISIERQGSFYTVLVDFIKQYAAQHAAEKQLFPRLIVKICPWLQRWAFKMEGKLDTEKWPEFMRSFTIGYGIIARK
jgi:hypothetical protein